MAPGAYYAAAVSWASAGGIVNGYGAPRLKDVAHRVIAPVPRPHVLERQDALDGVGLVSIRLQGNPSLEDGLEAPVQQQQFRPGGEAEGAPRRQRPQVQGPARQGLVLPGGEDLPAIELEEGE